MKTNSSRKGAKTQRNYLIRPAHRTALREFDKLRVAVREQIKVQNFEGAALASKSSRELALQICEDLACQFIKPVNQK